MSPWTKATVATRIKEPLFIIPLRLQFRLLNHLEKNPKVAKRVDSFYILSFVLFILKLQEYKLLLAVCVQISVYK